jgi:hypothetical protein
MPAIFDRTRRSFARGSGDAGPATWQKLPITVHPQEKTEWCWAAVTAAIADFKLPDDGWTQCAVASSVLEDRDCCGDPSSCNQPAALADALRAVGLFREPERGRLQPAEVLSEISSGRPLGAHIVFPGEFRHYVLITGYLAVQPPRFWIEDPEVSEAGDYSVDEFTSRYRRNGQWDATCLVT